MLHSGLHRSAEVVHVSITMIVILSDHAALLLQKNRFHNKWQYLYIESICNDPQVLEQNYRYKMMYSPDYKDVNTEEVSCMPVVLFAFCTSRP